MKSAGIEGGTEVSQTMAVFADEYLKANTKEERDLVLEEAKRYVKEDMIDEFVIGAGTGALTGGLADVAFGEKKAGFKEIAPLIEDVKRIKPGLTIEEVSEAELPPVGKPKTLKFTTDAKDLR